MTLVLIKFTHWVFGAMFSGLIGVKDSAGFSYSHRLVLLIVNVSTNNADLLKC